MLWLLSWVFCPAGYRGVSSFITFVFVLPICLFSPPPVFQFGISLLLCIHGWVVRDCLLGEASHCNQLQHVVYCANFYSEFQIYVPVKCRLGLIFDQPGATVFERNNAAGNISYVFVGTECLRSSLPHSVDGASVVYLQSRLWAAERLLPSLQKV